MVANATPSLDTYVQIFQGIIETWDSCVPWAQPVWLSEVVFFACMVMAFIYFYVLVVILIVTKRQKRFRSPFHRCIIILAVGDIITVITTSKEGAVQSCVLASNAVRHLAWESIGAFSIDLIIAVNLVIAIIRLSAVTTLYTGNNSRVNRVTRLACKLSTFQKYFVAMDCLLVFATVWSISMGVLHHLGVVKQVWYPEETQYRDILFFPFDLFRTPLQFAELGLTFIIYVIATVQLQRMKKAVNLRDVKKEARMLILAFMIFASELLYVYSANWIGNNYFHWGSSEFNANLNYTVRPITTGITPLFYIVFSSEIREACFFCFKKKGSKVSAMTKVSSREVHTPQSAR